MYLEKKVALITGASRGLGLEIAKGFISAGISKIFIVSRKTGDLEHAKRELIKKLVSKNQEVIAIEADLSIPSDVTGIFEGVKKSSNKLDILINNASLFGPIGNFDSVSFEEWLETINVNYVGTARITKALLPFLKMSRNAKIINIVGGGASIPYGCLSGYATSKVALIRFTEELALELRKYEIDVNALAPGPLRTRFIDKMLEAGRSVLGDKLFQAILEIDQSGGTPLSIPVTACLTLVSGRFNGLSGKMLSARYDDFEDIFSRKSEIENSDLYTLRRLT